MFTGIVQAKCEILAIEKQSGFHKLTIALPPKLLDKLEIGASVAHNGVCLTVTQVMDDRVFVDIMEETLAVTNLNNLNVGEMVNIERSLTFGTEIGGHLLSGHIHTQAQVIERDVTDTHFTLKLALEPQWMKYVLYKGFIGINGCSLTIGEVQNNHFMVHLIPETLRVTNLGDAAVGTALNIEIDSQTQTIVDTVERVLSQRNIH